MTDKRQQAVAALEPFALLADALDGETPAFLKKPGATILSYGGATLTNTHLREARAAWRALKERKK